MRKLIYQLQSEVSNLSPAMRWTMIVICALPALAAIPLLAFVFSYGDHIQAEIHLMSLALKYAQGADRIDVLATGQQLFLNHAPLTTLVVCTSAAFLIGTLVMCLFVRKGGSKKVSTSPSAA